MTVDEMKERMTNLEYIHWRVYYAREAQRQELASKMGKA